MQRIVCGIIGHRWIEQHSAWKATEHHCARCGEHTRRRMYDWAHTTQHQPK